MRSSRRIIFTFLGVLLLGIIVLVAVPYLNYLVYPNSPSKSTVKDATGDALIPEDRKNDELGASIHTEAVWFAKTWYDRIPFW